MFRCPLLALVCAGTLLACGTDRARDPTPALAPERDAARDTATERPAPRPALCGAVQGRRAGRIDDPSVDELSGLVRSGRTPGRLVAVEDSGNLPGLTVLRDDGRVLGFATIPGAVNTDWEGLAAGRGPGGVPSVYVGDIGDNGAERASIQVLRVPEPAAGATATAPAARLELRYPDGPRDAEALLLDPRTGAILVVTKALLGGRVYVLPRGANRPDGTRATLRRGPSVGLGVVTAGDVSADGRIVALRSYGTLAVWRRRGSEPLSRTLARAPCRAPADLSQEGQGEALALTGDGAAALTAPEATGAVVRLYAPPQAGR